MTSIERAASPSARSTALVIIPAAIIGKDGREICKKDTAASSTGPSAPDSRNKGSQNAKTAAAITACAPVA